MNDTITHEQLAELLIPMCLMPGCVNKASVFPVVMAWQYRHAVLKPRDKAFVFDMKTAPHCSECSKSISIDQFIDDGVWAGLCDLAKQQKLKPIVRHTVKLEWHPIIISIPEVKQDMKHALGIPRFEPEVEYPVSHPFGPRTTKRHGKVCND